MRRSVFCMPSTVLRCVPQATVRLLQAYLEAACGTLEHLRACCSQVSCGDGVIIALACLVVAHARRGQAICRTGMCNALQHAAHRESHYASCKHTASDAVRAKLNCMLHADSAPAYMHRPPVQLLRLLQANNTATGRHATQPPARQVRMVHCSPGWSSCHCK